jgi:threonine dehydrogenase-like Zn-dependent dehydrogenase
VVRPTTVGICGTDLHLLDRGPTGITIGHEISVVHDGQAYAVQPFAFCGECPSCRAGSSQRCVNTGGLLGVGRDGGMADALMLDPGCLVPLPPGVAASNASLVEPIAVAVHAAGLARLQPGMRVLVIGGGPIGQVTAVVAHDGGADVDAHVRHDAQRDCAERLGIRVGLGTEYDVVFDAAGSASSLALAARVARSGGAVVVPAVYWDDVALPGKAFCYKEVRLVPSMLYGHASTGEREADVAAAVLGRRPELGDALITHRFPLERAAEAFAAAADRASGAIKVVVDVEG